MAHDTDTSPEIGHNTSPQSNVVRNPDPALDFSHEHQHGHLHHSSHAVHDEAVSYTKGTTNEPAVTLGGGLNDNVVHHRHHAKADYDAPDYEKGNLKVQNAEAADLSSTPSQEEDPRNHRLSLLYRQIRPFVHMFLFLLFTG